MKLIYRQILKDIYETLALISTVVNVLPTTSLIKGLGLPRNIVRKNNFSKFDTKARE